MYYDDQILSCAYECPWQKRNKDCPYNEIEHLSFKEKIVRMNDMSEEKKELILKHHLFCTNSRK